MAATPITTKMAAAINYTYVTDSSADWLLPTLPNNTYFYDKADKLPYYKDASGNIIKVFETATYKTATLNFQTGTINPANSSTYVIPGNANYAPVLLLNVSPRHSVRTPIGGFVRSVQLSTFIQTSFGGTGWTGTFRIHNVTAGTFVDIITGYNFASGAYINFGRNDHYPLTTFLAVNEGDELQIRLITATSGTAPAGCYFTAQVYITQ
jgi:hypothetical protein